MPRTGRQLVVVGLLALLAPVAPAQQAHAAAGTAVAAPPDCVEPAARQISADVPWPQRRYDYAAIARLADGRGVTVAVLDSGVDATHPQLRGAVRAGADLVSGGDGRTDCVGHGTVVASLIAARSSVGAGLRGLAPAATILPIRVTDRHDAD